MKSHGLEPNNEPGPEQMEWTRREDRPHLQWGCLPSIPISLSCKSVILLSSILSANLKNKAAAKTLTSRKRRGYGRDGHSGLYLHYKRHLSYSQGSPGLWTTFFSVIYSRLEVGPNTGAREWAASSGLIHHQSQPYCHRRDNVGLKGDRAEDYVWKQGLTL